MDEATIDNPEPDEDGFVDEPDHLIPLAEGGPAAGPRRRAAPVVTLREVFRWLPPILVAIAAATYAVYFARLTIRHHNGFGTAGFDIGLYDQGLWLLSRFRSPFVTIMGRNLFGDHSSFILLPLVPFYWFGAGASFLLAVQSIALGSTAIPVYLTVRRLLSSRWAACGLAIAFLLQPSLGWTNAENFHPDSLVAPLLMTAIWAMVARRWRWFLVFGVLATLVKEDTLLVIIPLGLYAWARFGRGEAALPMSDEDASDEDGSDEDGSDEDGSGVDGSGVVQRWNADRNRSGLLLAGWSLLWTGFSLVLLRSLNSVGSLNAWRIPFGGPKGVIETAFKQPGVLWNYLVKGIDYPGENPDNRRMWYLWKLLSPVVFLIARAPLECCLFVLVVGLNIISNFFYQYNIEYHYTVIILPGLFFATTMAITRIKRVRWRRTAIVGVVASCLWTGYLWGPSPLSARPSPWSTDRAPWVAEGRALLRQVPPNVPISVFYGYVPHIAHRVEVYQFPVPWRDSYYRLPGDETAQIRPLRDRIEWVITRDVESSPDATVREAYNDMIKDFELVDQQGTGRLFRRRGLGGSRDGVAPVTVPPIPITTVVVSPVPTTPPAASVPSVPTTPPVASAPPIATASPAPVSVVSEGVAGPDVTPPVTAATMP